MKILITGATGLVGKPLVKRLLELGHQVHFLTTTHDKLNAIPGASGYFWDPQQGAIDESALIGVDTIIHLAGESVSKKWTPEYKLAIVESRVLSANLLYKILKNNPHEVRQIISASGIGIYPNSETETYAEDALHQDPGFIGQVVVKWEEAVSRFSNLGITTCMLRTGLVLARGGGALAEMEKPVAKGFAAPLGSGKQIYSWIHIADLVNLYIFAAERRLEGVYNAVAPGAVTNAVFNAELAKAMRKPYFMPPVPAFVLRMMLGEMHLILVTGQRVSAQKIMSRGFSFSYPDLSSALRNLYDAK